MIKSLTNLITTDQGKFTFRTLVLAIIIYPVLFIWQGGDLTDVGYLATIYQNFFPNLNNGIIIFSESFLSQLIGAIWLKLFPQLGIIGFKLLYVIYLYTLSYLTFQTLKKYARNSSLLLLGILCGLIFGTRFSALFISYDSISWFFLFLTGILANKSLQNKNYLWLYLAGISLVFSTLSRLPNISFALFLLPIIFYTNTYKSRRTLKSALTVSIKQYIVLIAGIFSCTALVYLLFSYSGIYSTYIDNLDLLNNTSNSSSYSPNRLLKRYFLDALVFLRHLIPTLSLILSISIIYSYSKSKNSQKAITGLFILLLYIAFIIYGGYSYSSRLKFLAPAVCAFPLFISIIQKNKFSTLSLIFILASLAQVAGTNTGLMLKLANGLMMIIPLSILILSEKKVIRIDNIKIYTTPILTFSILIISFLSLFARVGWIYHVDEGIRSRLTCTQPIEHNKMKAILTTKENALHIEKLTKAINQNIDDNKSLFIFGHQPMFYFLTEANPPIKKFWLMNDFVEVGELFKSLEKSIESTGSFPLVVDTKESVMGEDGQKRLMKFLEDFGYERSEQTADFVIWKK